MGALTFDALLRSLKRGAPDPVYFLHGDEDVLKDEAIRAVLERDAATLLLDAVEHDLGSLAQELDKLAALAAGRAATRSDVAALVGVRRGESLGDLVEAALSHQPLVAARRVEPVLDQSGMSGVRIVSALGTALIGT